MIIPHDLPLDAVGEVRLGVWYVASVAKDSGQV